MCALLLLFLLPIDNCVLPFAPYYLLDVVAFSKALKNNRGYLIEFITIIVLIYMI